MDFELSQECDQCLQAKYLSVANVRLAVKQYLGPPRIPQCQKYCAFGDFANQCRNNHQICGKYATFILPDTAHQCTSTRCINCSKLPNHPYDINHEAFDLRCSSMINFKKILLTKLVDEGIISNHIYVPKELQHCLHQIRDQLQNANVIPFSSIPSPTLRPNVWNNINAPLASTTSIDAHVPQPTPAIPNFIDFTQNTVKTYEDQLSNLSKQMSNITMLSIIQEHKVNYVNSLVENIMLSSFKLISETLPTLIRLLPDSSIHATQREQLSNQLQQTSIYLHSAYEQQHSFKKSIDQTKKLMIDSNVMTTFADRSLTLDSSITADMVTRLPSSSS